LETEPTPKEYWTTAALQIQLLFAISTMTNQVPFSAKIAPKN
jgi:hypothetical protein